MVDTAPTASDAGSLGPASEGVLAKGGVAAKALSEARPLVLVGAGKMGAAMLEGWLASGTRPGTVVVVEPHPSDAAVLKTPGLTVAAAPPDRAAHTLVLAVKPQKMAEVLPSLATVRGPETLVLSIAAGITIDTLAKLGPGPIVRAMPNTPASVGAGITAAVARDAPPEAIAMADDLLCAIGMVEWVSDEGLIDAATAVSGSGPAYVFHLVECLARAGEAEGLSPQVAAALARQTIIGAGALLARSELDPETLRRNVTSPGGTTAAALDVLMADAGGLQDLMNRAVHAAAERSRELGS